MRAVAAGMLVVFLTGLVPSVAFAQRSTGRARGTARDGAGAAPPQPAGPIQPGTPGSAYRTRPDTRPVRPRGISAARGLPYIWWWGYADVDYPYSPDVIDRSEEVTPPPAPRPIERPAPPSLIQPLPTAAPPRTQEAARGKLRLEVAPNSAQVVIDGFLMGTVEEISRLGTGLDLAAGWHRLEFRAPGYVTPAVNVTIEANRTFTYRGDLQPIVR